MKKKILLCPLLALLACTKHPGESTAPVTASPATLHVAAPTANARYAAADTVRIVASAIAPATIHGYELSIHKAGDTTTLYYAHIHDHNDTLAINQYWVNDQPAPANLELRIVLALDHEGHTLAQTVPFSIQ
ncbi:hypothetical protein [Flaviaesturariibacter terrae]